MTKKGRTMIIKIIKGLTIIAAFLMVTVAVLETNAFARAGGGRSSGSTGSRTYSRPSTPYSQPSPSQTAPSPYQQQPTGGGFFRNMAGGILGGMLGGMLFRSLGFGGGGIGGGGIGLFEVILIAGIAYMIYRMVKRRRAEPVAYQSTYEQEGYQQGYAPPQQDIGGPSQGGPADLSSGLAYIRQMDPTFAENRFTDNAMDIFFKIQSAWMNRDLAPVTPLFTDEMRGIFQGDIDRMLAEKRVNRLENIAVRSVEIAEAWQEQGQDFITARIYANLLDYTTDDSSGVVVEGSRTEPVKFEEFWTFTRPVGNNPWRLSAINQA
jgi:predicted lipid-binding transport protein (Tim44 family)